MASGGTAAAVAAPLSTAAPSRLAGRALAGVFGPLGRLRRGKPLHPKGVTLAGTLTRHGATPPFGASWLDTAGQDEVLVRLSRAVGLPPALPDVLGLALRLPGRDGPHDLLLATTGRGPVSRFVLVPRRGAVAGWYGSLLPYAASTRLVELASVPADARELPVRLDELVAELRARPLTLRLLAAPVVGAWRPFATLVVSGDVRAEVTFDPVLNPLPDLDVPAWARRMREPAYAAARRSRRAD